MIVHFVESMTGIRAAQTFRREPRNQEIFEELDERYRAANLASMRLIALFQPGREAARQRHHRRGSPVRRLAGHPGRGHRRGARRLPAVSAAVLRADAGDFQLLQHVAVSGRRAGEAVGRAGRTPRGGRTARPGRPAGTARGEVRFQDVRFHYHPDVPVLHRLDLVIPAGQIVAVVGATGAGKTTLAKLIARFYDPVTGRITLDGVDLRDLGEAALRRAVVMVTQENYLFGGSVADNIRFGRPSATTAEVEAAAAAVGVRGVRRLARRRGGQTGRPHVGRAAGSSSPSPGCSWPTRPCSSSTRPPPASTCPANGSCSGPCGPC